MTGINGIFAVNKPSGPTSAEIITKLKHYFTNSPVFEPRQAKLPHQKKFRRKSKKEFIKIGHGGTLDPLASGVLVVGIGNGTKQLTNYLGSSTKSYRAIAMFGCSTTTYDSEGKVLQYATTSHLADDLISTIIPKFTGDILQHPPVYSALKMNGKPLYEYARSGEPLPKEIQARNCKIEKLSVGKLNWDHEYKFPPVEANGEEKKYAKVLDQMMTVETEAKPDEEQDLPLPKEDEKYPVLEIDFTVSSGTYIRSLIHDMGVALGTRAHMVELTRLSQGPWQLDKNVFEVTDFLDNEPAKWEHELQHYLDNGPESNLKDMRKDS